MARLSDVTGEDLEVMKIGVVGVYPDGSSLNTVQINFVRSAGSEAYAAPSAAGLLDKATLVTAGWTVQTA